MSITLSPIEIEMKAISELGHRLVSLSRRERIIGWQKGLIYAELRRKFSELKDKAEAYDIKLPEQAKNLEAYMTSLGFAVDSEATRNTLEWLYLHFIERLNMGVVENGKLKEIHPVLLNMAAYRLHALANYLVTRQDAIEVLSAAGRDVLPTMSAFWAWFEEWAKDGREKVIPLRGGGRPRAFIGEASAVVEAHELQSLDIKDMIHEIEMPPAIPGKFYRVSVSVSEIVPPVVGKEKAG